MIHANDISHLWNKKYLTATELEQILSFVRGDCTVIISPKTHKNYTVTVSGTIWTISKSLYEKYCKYGDGVTTVAALHRRKKIANALA
jgi:hypothetical protein